MVTNLEVFSIVAKLNAALLKIIMTPEYQSLRAAYFTLGCKLNFAETSTIGKMLLDRGITRAADGETPDICIINTCSVTEVADKKGRQLIRRLATRWPEAIIVATGCYAQLKPEEVAAIEGVDIVLGADQKLLMADYLDKFLQCRREERHQIIETTPSLDIKTFRPSCERGERTRFFLKIQDGCDYFCTYCTIPFARGRSRSGRIADLVAMARDAAARGGREIVITGVNIGEFGRDTGESLLDLLRQLDAIEGIDRYRISSIEPNLLTDGILEWIATESRAFMPHFHIPLQAGSDQVLRLMNRRYDTATFRHRIEQVRRLIPDAFIGIDIIAGARGETEAEWLKGLEFVKGLPFTHLHVFPYSERPGTKALSIDFIVPQEEKHRRVAVLTRLSDERHASYVSDHIGQTRPVLWETIVKGTDGEPDVMHGFTDNYIRVEAKARPQLLNTISNVVITGSDGETAYGKHTDK